MQAPASTKAYLPIWVIYQAAWSNISVGEQQYLLTSSVAADCVYTDPATPPLHGHGELLAYLAKFQQDYPGTWFENQQLAVHHDQALADWTMLEANGQPTPGTSYARYGADGQLTQMTGFFASPTDPLQNAAQLATWNAYQAAWTAGSPAERQQQLSRSVAADCEYADPTAECHGLAALVAHVEQSRQHYPGASFRNDKFLAHHDQALSWWTMLAADGSTLATGTSYARFGDGGRLTQMTGFFNSARP